jgi:hypothetical protein
MTPSAPDGTGVVFPLGVFTGVGVGSGISGIKSSFLQDDASIPSEQRSTKKVVFVFFIGYYLLVTANLGQPLKPFNTSYGVF